MKMLEYYINTRESNFDHLEPKLVELKRANSYSRNKERYGMIF
ncbi:MAG TPA: hypothetical protein VEC16_01575 [Alphaproteobacteria bacterium]|nr:hypothetical protein [Alphaproteobacteria bacterium]